MTFQELIKQDRPVLVDFFASWCGPCRLMTPVLKEVKQRAGETVTIVKIDVDASPHTASTYQVQAVPTLILFKNGKPIWRKSGVVPARELEQVLKTYN